MFHTNSSSFFFMCIPWLFFHLQRNKCLNLSTDKIILSQHIIFNKYVFPFKESLFLLPLIPTSSTTSQLLIFPTISPPILSTFSSTSTTMQTPATSSIIRPTSTSQPHPSLLHVYECRLHKNTLASTHS
jgi:hypothetical protein